MRHTALPNLLTGLELDSFGSTCARKMTQPPPLSHPSPFEEDNDLASYPPDLKREGSDWFALFNPNPKVKKVLDVNLVHTLTHESVVCCVRFSQDGKWLATGCNRTAQIYDAKTGVKIWLVSFIVRSLSRSS